MTPDLWLIGTIFAALFGACVGSFLNVCIYRIPLDLSVAHPRSHCMNCQKLIPWYWNIPILSYFMLRGRCRYCKAPFSFRYAFVELLTALLFVLVCAAFPPGDAAPILGFVRLPSVASVPVAWLFLSGLIIGTFVDFDHYIIPDSVTIGGAVAGILVSAVVPEIHGVALWWEGLARAALGAVVGFALLYAVVLLGKLAFGRKRVVLDPPQALSFVRTEADRVVLRLGDEEMPWDELFYRATDRWIFECTTVGVAGRPPSATRAVLSQEGLDVEGTRVALADLPGVSATVASYVYPREAMGFGDVKLMAAVGAFLGWKATLFALIAASLFGTIVGVTLIALGRRQLGSRLPFGPYIALGAVVWLFWGPRIVSAYLNLFLPPETFL